MFPRAFILYAYYAALYSPIAVWVSFFPLWLRSKGVTEADVGLCLAISAVLGVLVNPIAGGFADRTGRRKALLLVLVAATAVASLLNFAAETVLAVAIAFLTTRLCSASLIPLSESIILANLRPLGLDFGRVRACGSAAVVVLALVLGIVVDRLGLGTIPLALTLAFAVQGLLGIFLPPGEFRNERLPAAPVREVLRIPRFSLLVGSAAVSQACHAVFYAYSTFYWLASGLSATTVGALWSLGVTAEVIAFALGGRLVRRVTPAGVIAIGCAAGVLRWGILGFSGSLPAAVLVQLLQGGTLGLSQVGAAYQLSATVPPQILSSGTGVYASSTGLLSAVALLAGGIVYARTEGGVFLMTSGLCVLGLASALVLLAGSRRD